MNQKQYFVYIISNFSRTTLYVGITNNLIRRIWEHKNEVIKGFSQEYHLHNLLYYEPFNDPILAIEREKQIKSWSRNKKDELITKSNSGLIDLYQEILQ